jgi:thiamine-phosphate pyrophosphorylase
MQADLTPGAERALVSATSWAIRLGEAEVTPLHVLLGLLEEEEGLVARLLQDQNVDAVQVRERLLAGAPLEPKEPGVASSNPLAHALVRSVVFAAQPLARSETGTHQVASHHLFYALLELCPDWRDRLAQWGFRWEPKANEAMASSLPVDEPLQIEVVGDAISLARIFDAAANRAREAARVLEDYARFALNEFALAERLKQLRHDLTETCHWLPEAARIAARDSQGDVGARVEVESERQRPGALAVVAANAKRLQEALRSLEEFSKLHAAAHSERFKRLRYLAYTVEKSLLTVLESRRRLERIQLCLLVSVREAAASLEWTISEAVAGGVDMVQLREKGLADREWLARARRAAKAARAAGAVFVVNDRADLAYLVDADGVHVGQTDLPVAEARRLIGPERLVGVSTHSPAELDAALEAGADYVGVGPVYASSTKSFSQLAGLEFVRAAAERTGLPAFAIGGITPANIQEIVRAGLRRVAVGQALTAADNPRHIAQQLKAALTK